MNQPAYEKRPDYHRNWLYFCFYVVADEEIFCLSIGFYPWSIATVEEECNSIMETLTEALEDAFQYFLLGGDVNEAFTQTREFPKIHEPVTKLEVRMRKFVTQRDRRVFVALTKILRKRKLPDELVRAREENLRVQAWCWPVNKETMWIQLIAASSPLIDTQAVIEDSKPPTTEPDIQPGKPSSSGQVPHQNPASPCGRVTMLA